MEITICGKTEEWTLVAVEIARDRAIERETHQEAKDIDDAWLSQWAASATVSKYELLAQILTEPVQLEVEPWHCGRPLRFIVPRPLYQRRWPDSGSYVCDECGFTGGHTTVHFGRAKAKVEWEPIYTKRGITMNPNGIYYICGEREAHDPGPTAGQVLGSPF